MKKLLLASAVLLGLGAASSSYAGVRFDIGLPLPPLPGVVIGGPRIYAPPVYAVPPRVVVRPPYLTFGYGGGYDCYRDGYGGYYGGGWDHRRYDRWDHRRGGHGGYGGHDRDHRGSHGRW
jgi:hypothetical protein